MPSVVSRRTVLERLRRVLFAPTQLLAVGALTLAIVHGNAAFAQDYFVSGPLEAKDYAVDGFLDLSYAYYADPSASYGDYSIDLNGGYLLLSTAMIYGRPSQYDADARKAYTWNFTDVPAQSPEEQAEEAAKYHYILADFYGQGAVEKFATVEGHHIDIGAGGAIDIQDDYGHWEKSRDIHIAAQTVDDGFFKLGDGTLVIHSGENKDNVARFNSYLSVYHGILEIQGDGEYNDGVLLAWDGINGYSPTLRLTGGNHEFNAEVWSYDGGIDTNGASVTFNEKVTLGAEGEYNFSQITLTKGTHRFKEDAVLWGGGSFLWTHDANTVFEKDLYLDVYSYAYLGGSQQFNGNVVVGDSAYMILASHSDNTGRAVWADDSTLVLGDWSRVVADAKSLNVDIIMSSFGFIEYTNVQPNDQEEVVAGQIGYDNKFFVTYDEYQTPTVLDWSSGRDNIEYAVENKQVINKNIVGLASGEIQFYTQGDKTVSHGTTANGYTVVIDAKDPRDETVAPQYLYNGDTIVNSAFLVVKGATNFGLKDDECISHYDKANFFCVLGESYYPDEDNVNRWEVRSCGMLGFYRGDESAANVAPSITASTVEFLNGHNYGIATRTDGSRIWIDATYHDASGKIAQVDHKLGAINADVIVFGNQTKIWYDGISSVAADVKTTFDLNAETIKYDDLSLSLRYDAINGEPNTTVDELKDATVGEIEDLFGAGILVDAKYALAAAPLAATELTEEERRAQIASAGTVTVTSRNLADYASDVGMSAEEINYAQKLDEARLRTEADQAFNDALYNETDASKVTQTIHNLSLLGYDMLNAQGHFGNPTSAFFGGSSVSGEAKRGQEAELDWNDELTPKPKSVVEKRQNGDALKRTLWAAYTHTSVEGDDYTYGGIKTHGYQLRRDGVVGGVKRQIDATTSGGLFFGISTPEITSRKEFKGRLENGASYGDFASSMEMTDFQFAVHVEKVFADVWELAAYVGGGAQGMDWERKVNLTNGGLYGFDASGSGNTFTATLYLSNRLDVGDRLTLRPTVGVDSEHSWLYGFTENAIDGEAGNGVAVDYYMNMFAQNYTYAKTYYNRNTARAGLSLACDAPSGYAGLNARAFYGVKLGGDDAPELSYRSHQYRFENMTSHEMGDCSLNVGGGGFVHWNPQKTLTATGDVNAIWYKNAQTFNVTGGVSYRF